MIVVVAIKKALNDNDVSLLSNFERPVLEIIYRICY
jgi:hypothetical protein